MERKILLWAPVAGNTQPIFKLTLGAVYSLQVR